LVHAAASDYPRHLVWWSKGVVTNGVEVFMQSAAPVQLTQMPPRPTCSPSAFSGADCQERWHIYNQAAHQVVAPLQQQIEDLNKLTADQQAQIEKLSDQIEADSVVALQAKLNYATAVQAKTAAHTEGLQQGAGIGVGATLILCGLIFAIRRLTLNLKDTEKPEARGCVDITIG
jgi:hypothetical protein